MVDDFEADAACAVVLISFYEVVLCVRKKDSPRTAQNLADADGVENGGAGFPIGVFDFAVFLVEGVAGVGGGLLLHRFGRFLPTHPRAYRSCIDLPGIEDAELIPVISDEEHAARRDALQSLLG